MASVSIEKKIFLSAEGFWKSAFILGGYTQQAGGSFAVFPTLTNQAFACELYLKCLLHIKTTCVPKIHELHKLFDNLPVKERSHLVKTYKNLCKLDPSHDIFFKANPGFKDDLRSVLEKGANVFQTVRYAYEGMSGNQLIYFNLPVTALRIVILENHPEWTP